MKVEGGDVPDLNGKEVLGVVEELEKRETEEYGDYMVVTVSLPEYDSYRMTFGLHIPNKVTSKSHIGQLLEQLGVTIEKGEMYDLEELLVDKKLKFEVDENDNGFFEVVKTRNKQLAVKVVE